MAKVGNKGGGREMMPPRPGLVTIAGRDVPYMLVRVRSRKRITVLVNQQGGVEVRIPPRVTIKQAERFLIQCGDWVLKRLAVVQGQIARRPVLTDGAVIPYLDDALILRFNSRRGRGIEMADGELLLPGIWSEDVAQLQNRLELWYKREAKQHFQGRLRHWASVMGVHYNRLTIRSQKTIWGSCSAKNNINLNWRLLWMPYRVADYVVIHELCHLDHLDHSAEFWARVESFEPDYRTLRTRLRQVQAPW